MAGLKPDLVLVPYGWAAEEEDWPLHGQELRKTVSKAARIIRAPVVGVDLVGEITHGPWTGMTYGGQSVAADAEGRIIAVAKDRDREVLVVQITIEIDED
jgi:predicted amidohydrolase